MRKAIAGIFSGVVALLVVTELATWRASRQSVGRAHGPHGQDIVVVLGYRSRPDGHANYVQRMRTRIALRSVSSRGRLLFTGGAVVGEATEASVMANYARLIGFPADRIILEEASRTTWENMRNALPYLETADSIVIASNTFQARRARRFLAEQAPHLASRLRRGEDFRWGENLPLKIYLAIYEIVRSRLR